MTVLEDSFGACQMHTFGGSLIAHAPCASFHGSWCACPYDSVIVLAVIALAQPKRCLTNFQSSTALRDSMHAFNQSSISRNGHCW